MAQAYLSSWTGTNLHHIQTLISYDCISFFLILQSRPAVLQNVRLKHFCWSRATQGTSAQPFLLLTAEFAPAQLLTDSSHWLSEPTGHPRGAEVGNVGRIRPGRDTTCPAPATLGMKPWIQNPARPSKTRHDHPKPTRQPVSPKEGKIPR